MGLGWGSDRIFEASGSHAAATSCRSSPLAGVHDPSRLKIFKSCAIFVGTVVKAPRQYGDGDVVFNVKPDSGYEWMLNAHNLASDHGLHVEVVPADQPGCTPGQPVRYGICTGVNVVLPPLGARIRATGAYVFDSWAGPNELHPVWNVEILSGNPPPPPPPIVHLKATLTRKGLGKSGARHGHGKVALTLSGQSVCWRFTQLVRIGRPTRAGIRFKPQGKPGRTVLALGRRYRPRGCVAVRMQISTPLTNEPADYYVVVASKRHRFGAVRGRLAPG